MAHRLRAQERRSSRFCIRQAIAAPCRLALSLLTAAAAPPTTITICASAKGSPYARMIAAVRERRQAQAPKHSNINAVALPTLHKADDKQARSAGQRIVSVRTKAGRAVTQHRPAQPVLSTLIPETTCLDIAGQTQKPLGRLSAIYPGQPISRRLARIRNALPKHAHIGVVLELTAELLAPELKTAVRDSIYELRMVAVNKRNHLVTALAQILDKSDVLLAITDPRGFNRYTTQNLLLATLRRQVPVIGLSNVHVQAGVLAAIFSTPSQSGVQSADMIPQAADPQRGLPPTQSPRSAKVALNQQAAQSRGMLALRIGNLNLMRYDRQAEVP